MRKEEFFEVLGELDDDIVEGAKTPMNKSINSKVRRSSWPKWGAIAACLCLIIGGIVLFRGALEQPHSILYWSEGWDANDYFMYSNTTSDGTSTSSSLDSSAILYAEERAFSDWREQLEADKIIPVINSHPLFDCIVHYNNDGSIFSVNISWHRRGKKADYSDLKIIAGYQEVEQIKDCVVVEVDANGNIVEPNITVTERDGIQIVAEGSENRGKAITFQNDNGWYQISGSSNDSYETVVELLDWFWDNPIDFEKFPMDAGDEYSYTSLAETPDAFNNYLPDFTSFGFIEEQTTISLKNGIPVRFEGHYVAHASEELVKAQDYYDVEGYTTMHWCFETEPDFYDVQRCIGELAELTEQLVTEELLKESSVAFMWDGNCVIVYPGDTTEAWELIESLMSK